MRLFAYRAAGEAGHAAEKRGAAAALAASEREALLETVRYDISFRQLCVERGNIPEGCLPFLLGRPLSETLVMFGLALTRNNNNRMGLVRRGEGRYGGPVFPDGKDLYR